MSFTTLAWFRRAARVAALLAAIVVVVGAWVRLTNAGLGCPDWPGCYGQLHPAQVATRLAEANAAFPARPFDYQKALHEMVHRYIATGLGLLIMWLAALSWWNRRDPAQPRLLPWAVLAVVCAQGALGAYTVTMLVTPLMVTLHLVGGLTTLSLLWWLSLAPERRDVKAAERPVRRLALLALAVLGVQLLLGGWTSSNYAGIACPDFPTCQNRWWPTGDWHEAFVLWRGLGVDYEGGVLGPKARTAIHLAHRLGALAAATTLLALAVLAYRRAQAPSVRSAAVALGAALLLQLLIGISLIWQGFPLWLGTAHNAGAAFLLLALLRLIRALWPLRQQIAIRAAGTPLAAPARAA